MFNHREGDFKREVYYFRLDANQIPNASKVFIFKNLAI